MLMSQSSPGLFQAIGVEIEYMIVRADDLSVFPAADQVLKAAAGEIVSEVEMGDLSWSNELALHVLELKTNGPAPSVDGLARAFAADVKRANAILAPLGGRLMPGGAHPLMDPDRETRLWPHEYSPVYEAYNRIFSCKGHGWSNLQSMHLNLPFADDAEFGRLHAAIRLLLPILPALAASTPILDGRPTGFMDSRLERYRGNSARIPSITGRVVPEPVYTMDGYEESILKPMYRDIAPLDPEGLLQHEWLNSRGAIARFDRGAIEIRVIDSQECPMADLAVAALTVESLKALAAERFAPLEEQQRWPVGPLANIFLASVNDADQALIANEAYARTMGYAGPVPCTAGDLWRSLAEAVLPGLPAATREECRTAVDVILDKGPLARRLSRAVGRNPERGRIVDVYRELCGCLDGNRMFNA